MDEKDDRKRPRSCTSETTDASTDDDEKTVPCYTDPELLTSLMQSNSGIRTSLSEFCKSALQELSDVSKRALPELMATYAADDMGVATMYCIIRGLAGYTVNNLHFGRLALYSYFLDMCGGSSADVDVMVLARLTFDLGCKSALVSAPLNDARVRPLDAAAPPQEDMTRQTLRSHPMPIMHVEYEHPQVCTADLHLFPTHISKLMVGLTGVRIHHDSSQNRLIVLSIYQHK